MIKDAIDEMDSFLTGDGPFSDSSIKAYNKQYESLKDYHKDADAKFWNKQRQMLFIVGASVAVATLTGGVASVALSGLGVSGMTAGVVQVTAVAAATTFGGQPLGMFTSQGYGMLTGNEGLANMMSYEDYNNYFDIDNLTSSFLLNVGTSFVGLGLGKILSKSLMNSSSSALRRAVMSRGVGAGVKKGVASAFVQPLKRYAREIMEEYIEENVGSLATDLAESAGASEATAKGIGWFTELMVGGVNSLDFNSADVLKVAGIKSPSVRVFNGKFKYRGSRDSMYAQLNKSFGTDVKVEHLSDGTMVVDYLAGKLSKDGESDVKTKFPPTVMTVLGGKIEIEPEGYPIIY